MDRPTAAVEGPTHRLIPSRFPPVSAFEQVTSAEDLAAVMELEGWTNDRLVAERLARLPRDQWVFGSPCASVVMAAFLHAAPAGGRFTSGQLGGWYAGLAPKTAIAEVAHHLRREARFRRKAEMRVQYRAYTARLAGAHTDIRGLRDARPDLYHPAVHAASQAFGEAVRAAGGAGILYDSLRHRGGVNAVAFRPRNVTAVVQAAHYEITAPLSGPILARTLK